MQQQSSLETVTMGFNTWMEMAIAWRHVIDRFSVCLHQGGEGWKVSQPGLQWVAWASSSKSRCCIRLPVSKGQQALLQCNG